LYYKSTLDKHKLNFSFIAFFLVCTAIAVFIHLNIGLIGLAIGVALLTYQGGIEIDVSRQRYRNYMVVLGVTVGEWQKLSPIKYVTVVRYLGVTGETESGAIDGVAHMYKLSLAVDDKRRVVKIKTLALSDALSEAMKIGEALDVKVLDCTTPNRKWIRE